VDPGDQILILSITRRQFWKSWSAHPIQVMHPCVTDTTASNSTTVAFSAYNVINSSFGYTNTHCGVVVKQDYAVFSLVFKIPMTNDHIN